MMHTIHMTIHRGLQVAEVGHCERPRGIVGRRRRCALLVLLGGCGSLAGPRITIFKTEHQPIRPLGEERRHELSGVGLVAILHLPFAPRPHSMPAKRRLAVLQW